MGLRVNHNLLALSALRYLRVNNRAQAKSLERLSTGLRIIRASDDPAGLTISTQLRAQISSLNKAVENTQRGMNLISTADAALQEIGDLLVELRDAVVFALNDGVSTPEQIQAEQASVDEAIAAVNRIASTTRYSEQSLLNGNVGYVINSSVPSQINDLFIRSVEFPQGASAMTFNIRQITSATRAWIEFSSTDAPNAQTTLRITGPLGTAEATFFSTRQATSVQAQINTLAAETGVFASMTPNGLGSNLLLTEEFGTAQTISVEVVDGTIWLAEPGETLAARTVSYVGQDEGGDAELLVDGQLFTGQGRFFNIMSNRVSMQFNLAMQDDDSVWVDYIAAGNLSITVRPSGMQVQMRELPRLTDLLFAGIPGMTASTLGFEEIQDVITRATSGSSTSTQGGMLTSLRTGYANDLETNPANALRIVDRAIDRNTSVRSFLGALVAFDLESNLDALESQIENLQAAESDIRDLDFAAETANYTRTQILFQAGTSVLASANLIPQAVLTLLQ